MASELQGLRSMSVRLSKLEAKERRTKKSDSDSDSEDSLSRLVNEMKKKEHQNKKASYKTILAHFDKDLDNMVLYVDEPHFVDVVIFAINYVEENALKIATYLGVKLVSEFKQSLAESFILHRLKNFSSDTIKESINSIHALIFPKEVRRLELPTMETEKKKKGGFFGKK